MNIKYLTRVLTDMKLDRVKYCINKAKESAPNKTKVGIFFDMMWCTARYGAGFHDYIIADYPNLTTEERRTQMTRLKNKKLVLMVNDPEFSKIFDNKNLFYEKYKKFLNREYVDLSIGTKEEILNFLNGKEYVIAKPSKGEGGKGIAKIKISDYKNNEEIYDYLMNPANNFGLLESLLTQHEEISRLYPCSINCLRIVTLMYKGNVEVLCAVLKSGNGGHFVDNFTSGGYSCTLDEETGEVVGDGHPENMIVEKIHPYSKVAFRDIKVPFYKECVDMVKEAAFIVPEVGYIGWDVCITPTGPALVEGNNYSAYDFTQVPDEGRKNIGILPKVHKLGIKL